MADHPDAASVARALASCSIRWREPGAVRTDAAYDILADGGAGRVAFALSGDAGDADARAAEYQRDKVAASAAVVAGDEPGKLSYAVYGAASGGYTRFPEGGFIRGGACDLGMLARACAGAARPGVAGEAAGMLRQAAARMRGGMDLGAGPPAVTALMWLDGALAVLNVGGGRRCSAAGLAEEWRGMAVRGGPPVFGPAIGVLERMGKGAEPALEYVWRAAEMLHGAGPRRAAEAAAGILPGISGDRGSAAEFYTKPPVAALLANLVISEGDVPDWGDGGLFATRRLADLACGTGALLRAGFERVRRMHERHGGTTDTVRNLHRDAVRRGMVGLDVHPAAAHMAASALAAMVPGDRGGHTAMGWMGVNGGHTGSIELAGGGGAPSGQDAGRVAAGAAARDPVSVPRDSCDWIIMNPPYSRTRIGRAAFDIAGLSKSERVRCQKRWGDLIRYMPARKTAGMAATYVAIAGVKLKPGGRMGFVLPISAASVEAWSDTRDYIERNFTDVTAITVGSRPAGDSFSEDTVVGEMLLVAKKLAAPASGASPVRCVTLDRSPRNPGEAAEAARAVSRALNAMEASGARTQDIVMGEGAGRIYSYDPDGRGAPWSPLGIYDVRLARTAIEMARGRFCFLDGRSHDMAVGTSPMREVFGIGPTHHVIGYRSGNSPMGAFEVSEGSGPDSFMWTADSRRQSGLMLEPAYTGAPGPGSDAHRERMRQKSGTLFYTRRIGWCTQKLVAATTARPAMGGNAWTVLMHGDVRVLRAAALWFNSTMGMLVHWTRGQRTHRGRSNTEMRALKEIPCPRFGELDGDILDGMAAAFERMAGEPLMPAGRAYEDPARRDIDAAAAKMMGLPDGVLAELDKIRRLFCGEPTVNVRAGRGGNA